jgi:hypothetical protein
MERRVRGFVEQRTGFFGPEGYPPSPPNHRRHLMSREPMTLAGLADDLGISKASSRTGLWDSPARTSCSRWP